MTEMRVAYTLEEKLDWALAGKARWEARLAEADAAHERAHEMGGGIPGFGGSGNQRAARQVRSAFEYTWAKVRTVNAVTVSVETGYSWTDKVSFDKILEVRK